MKKAARTLWDYALSERFVPVNVAAAVEKPEREESVEGGDLIRENVLTEEEIEVMLRATPKEYRPAVLFLLGYGRPVRRDSRLEVGRLRLEQEPRPY